MKLALLGDIALIGRYNLVENPAAEARIKVLAEALQAYDVVLANLESPLTNKTKSGLPRSIHLRSPEVNAALLKALHVSAVSLANNHMYDFGRKGLQDTIRCLGEAGIGWYGIGGKTFTAEKNGSSVRAGGYCCYTTHGLGYGPDAGSRAERLNVLSRENLEAQLAKDKAEGFFSILSLHWGKEHTHYPNFEHLQLAKSLMAQQPLLIHGHHSHTVQGILPQNGGLAAFSQGNALFDDCRSLDGRMTLRQNEENQKSFLLEAEIEGCTIRSYRYRGFRDTPGGIVWDEAVTAEVRQYSDFDTLPAGAAAYEEVRRRQYEQVIQEKFGKRDLGWYLSKINYNAVLNRLLAIYRRRKYASLSRSF